MSLNLGAFIKPTIALAVLASVLVLGGCNPVHNNPPVYVGPVVVGDGEKIWLVSHTGSMKPFLQGGEAVITKDDFDAIQVGQILVYKAPFSKDPVCHRAIQKDGYGWIMSGDAAKNSESWLRVTKNNYLGTVVVVYKIP